MYLYFVAVLKETRAIGESALPILSAGHVKENVSVVIVVVT